MKTKLKTISIGLDADLIQQLEDWRRTQDKIPSFAESLRKMAKAGLKAEEKAHA